MKPIKLRWMPDDNLNQHISRCFPKPSETHYEFRHVLHPPDPHEVWNLKAHDLVDLVTTKLQSRLINFSGTEFWAWVHEEDGVWNLYF